MLIRLTISFTIGCLLHVTNCWGTRLLSSAEESLYLALQIEVERKVQNFPQKFARQFCTTRTCLTLCEMLETSTPAGGWALGKAPVKTDPVQGAISRETIFF